MTEIRTAYGMAPRICEPYESPVQRRARLAHFKLQHGKYHYLCAPSGDVLFVSRFRFVRDLVCKLLKFNEGLYDAGIADN
jgi:hypothetical protein